MPWTGDGATDAWFDRELADCRFADERLGKRFRQLVERMEGAMGASIPLACQTGQH
ncbi:IS4/Tn5 family transposase DNA-binding protein [Mesorhizobium delmotii]|uniref:IS4/Tn5 family transposase DNA-binding protein n=1 Tax=Mesorhizobium delmotii TaxID=1631247 RepID=UPI00245369FC|nr:transposase DNA-binding-containing protein [Mesorhizobium delmotii]